MRNADSAMDARLGQLRDRLRRDEQARRAVRDGGDRLVRAVATHTCMTCGRGTGMPEKHRGHRLVRR